jgi:hypothetical protein
LNKASDQELEKGLENACKEVGKAKCGKKDVLCPIAKEKYQAMLECS